MEMFPPLPPRFVMTSLRGKGAFVLLKNSGVGMIAHNNNKSTETNTEAAQQCKR